MCSLADDTPCMQPRPKRCGCDVVPIFRHLEPAEPTPPPWKPGDVVVAYRESDRLLADAFDTDVPVLAWARIPGEPT